MVVKRILSLSIGLLVLLPLPLAGVVPPVSARGNGRALHAYSGAGNGGRCKTRAKQAGTVMFSDWEFPDSLNPYQTGETVSFAVINAMEDTLVYFDQSARLQPELLATLPSTKNGGILDSGKTYVLHLKPGVRWSNGAELTAQDVKFSWEVSMDKATGPACAAIGCDFIGSIDTKGAYEVDLHMRTVYAATLGSALAFTIMPHTWPGAWNNDPHAAAARLAGDPAFDFEGPGYPTDGAFQVIHFITDDRIVLKPMPYYSDMNCGPYLSTLAFSFYSDKNAMIAAAAAGETDITGLGGGYTAADWPLLQKHVGVYKLAARPSFDFELLELNHDPTYKGKPNPLSSANVRLALALALDKLGLIRSALGLTVKQARGYEAWTPWVNTSGLATAYTDKSIKGQWDPLAGRFVEPGTAQAVTDAKKLLAATSYRGGFTVDFCTTSGDATRQASASVIAASWARIGVKVNLNYVPAAVLFADWEHQGILDHGAFQVSLHSFSTTPEPDANRSLLQSGFIDRRKAAHSPLNQNYSAISDPLIDRDFDLAAHSLSPTTQRNNYYAIQIELDKLAHWIMLYFRPVTITWKPAVSPIYNNPAGCQVTCNVYNWSLKS